MVDIGNFNLNYTGVFDYYRMYYYCLEWLVSRRFRVQYNFYKDKPAGPGQREKGVKLKGTVNIDEYYQWNVNITIETYESVDVTVDFPDGTKKNMVRGKLFFMVSASVEMDYRKKFKTPFFKKMKSLLFKTVHNWKFKAEHWGPLYYGIASLNQDIKKILHTDTAVGAYSPGY